LPDGALMGLCQVQHVVVLASSPAQEVGEHLPLALDLDHPSLLEQVAIAEQVTGPLGDLDASWTPVVSIRLAVLTVSPHRS
jgi:hypothetical protein